MTGDMKNFALTIGLVASLAGFAPYTHAKEVRSEGLTSLEVSSAGWKAQVLIRTKQVDIGSPGSVIPAVRENSCTYSRYPCSLVQSIEISVESSKIFVPRSAYADLSDLRDASVVSKHGSMVLILKGGDASEFYTVKLFFDKEHVYRRLLFPSQGGGKPSEDAKYNLIDVY